MKDILFKRFKRFGYLLSISCFLLILTNISCQKKSSIFIKSPTWVPLFNGKDLTGWEIVGAGDWKVEDGILVGSSEPTNPSGSWLINRNDYNNFHLRVKFQINESGMGGLCFRLSSQGKDNPSENGYKINIDFNSMLNPTGTIMNVARAYKVRERIPGKDLWQKLELWVENDRIVVLLNDDKVAEGFDRKYLIGAIGIQISGEETALKIKGISVLPRPDCTVLEPTIEEQLENAPGTWKSLFNGKDITGWKQPSGDAKWIVQDGALTVMPGGTGWIFYAEESFSNFIFRLKFKVGETCNSGVAYRYQFSHGNRLPSWFRSEVQVFGNDNLQIADGTGSIYALSRHNVGLMKESEWNELEIYALGEHIVTHVNGKKASEAINTATLNGAVGVSAHDPKTSAQFKDIEIKKVDW